ncbi:Ubiquitin- modifier 1 [Coemansia javaensis]|uniref:Ubiquitin-related modifier 1 n=1 Tax=Coemansia javaensis TaxID=2761396 RepID=A0A9W8HFY1_9FUNG|nr:Ubiquitin- modifier 1 [Coemansia javaensis]
MSVSMSAYGSALRVTVEFAGGIDAHVKPECLQMVDGAKLARIELPRRLDDSRAPTMRSLIAHVAQHCFASGAELFSTDDELRPGILAIINDADWEITEDGVDKYDYVLQDQDAIVFVSTLHGG